MATAVLPACSRYQRQSARDVSGGLRATFQASGLRTSSASSSTGASICGRCGRAARRYDAQRRPCRSRRTSRASKGGPSDPCPAGSGGVLPRRPTAYRAQTAPGHPPPHGQAARAA
eukprot:6398401-Prymnesium_polylepis.3